jgi:hypothetical protein
LLLQFGMFSQHRRAGKRYLGPNKTRSPRPAM